MARRDGRARTWQKPGPKVGGWERNPGAQRGRARSRSRRQSPGAQECLFLASPALELRRVQARGCPGGCGLLQPQARAWLIEQLPVRGSPAAWRGGLLARHGATDFRGGPGRDEQRPGVAFLPTGYSGINPGAGAGPLESTPSPAPGPPQAALPPARPPAGEPLLLPPPLLSRAWPGSERLPSWAPRRPPGHRTGGGADLGGLGGPGRPTGPPS